MLLTNNTPIALGIHAQCRELLEYDLLEGELTCFVVKIANHDLLSVLLLSADLRILYYEIEQIVTTTMKQTPNPILGDRLVSFSNYITFIIKKANYLVIRHLAYLIYHNIQLNISNNYPNISVECKISSVDLTENSEGNLEAIQNLFCKLASSKCNNYYIEFDRETVKSIMHDTAKLNLFKKSLCENTFSFAYQPIVDRNTGDIPHYECLLRLPNENSELVSAGAYIEVAERAGLNNVVDQVVLNMAVNELKAAHNVSLTVNISNSGIIDSNLLQTARLLLSNHSIAKRLVIEITETSLNNDFEKTRYFADTMHNFGCKIAIDDFGSGFTSFKQLQHLPVDIIKIDGSFIKDVVYNQRDQHLVASLIEIAKNLNAKTVAEFVENGEIAKFLLDVGIDYMQGNFFSPALNYRVWNKK